MAVEIEAEIGGFCGPQGLIIRRANLHRRDCAAGYYSTEESNKRLSWSLRNFDNAQSQRQYPYIDDDQAITRHSDEC